MIMLRRSILLSFITLLPRKTNAMWPFDSSKRGTTVTPTGLRIRDMPANRPEFERVYSADLGNGKIIEVRYRTYINRSNSGELDQPGGRYVLFDPDNVADKILDPALVPLVQARCDEIKQIDAAYIKSKPSEFIDEDGVKWRRFDGV